MDERDVSTDIPEGPKAEDAPAQPREVRIMGFLCEWSVNRPDFFTDDLSAIRELPHVKIIQMPCSGMLKPDWMTKAIDAGYYGSFVLGCPMIDCHFREGNRWVLDRLAGRRQPYLKKGTDPNRVRGYFLEAVEEKELIEQLKQFTEELRALGPPPPPKAKTKKAAPTKTAAAAAKPAAPAAAKPVSQTAAETIGQPPAAE
jgi:F420-non-reducing hydrogenase iron-sulfur subunit